MPIYEPSPFAPPQADPVLSPNATSRARRAAGVEPTENLSEEPSPTPAKRRATRRRTAENALETETVQPEATEAPVKTRRSRKTAPAADPGEDSAPESVEAKPRRRSRTRSAPASTTPEESAPTHAPAPAPVEPPAPVEACPAASTAPPPLVSANPTANSPSETENRESREDRFSRKNRRRFRSRRRDRRERGERSFPNERPGRQDAGDSSEGYEEGEFEALPPDDGVPPVYQEGVVEVSGKGFGFLREAKAQFVQSKYDTFVTPEVIHRYNLRDGIFIKGQVRRGMRGPQLFKLTEIEGQDPESWGSLPVFEELTSINPIEWLRLETEPERYTTRVIDLMAPVGKGQRGLIVAPPRTGKTTLLQHVAEAVVKNHPEMKLLILLVDERPEEVTEIRRTLPQAELFASSNDSDLKSHTRIAQLAVERARRLVEMGRDVFLLMDSLTRIGRAFNNAQNGGGRTMSGGVDTRALEIPRRLFASARNTEEAGSLTIMATALIETGSRMDELIFLEFKGTGNMELVLDRRISDQRIYPAVDIFQSGTRREELLLPADTLHKISVIRRGLAGHKPLEAMERLLFFLRKHPTNAEMLSNIPG